MNFTTDANVEESQSTPSWFTSVTSLSEIKLFCPLNCSQMPRELEPLIVQRVTMYGVAPPLRWMESEPPERLTAMLLAEARAIEEEDRQMCRAMGRVGAGLIREGQGVLTHCQLRSDKSDVHLGFAWKDLIAACELVETPAKEKSSPMLAASAVKP